MAIIANLKVRLFFMDTIISDFIIDYNNGENSF